MMAQIREQLLTKEAKALIAGKTTPLDKRYGDKELALVNVRYKLASLDTSNLKDTIRWRPCCKA